MASSILKALLSGAAALFCATSGAGASLLTIHDAFGNIGTVDTVTGVATINASMSATLTDIAYAPDGTLYGMTFNNLYIVDPMTGALTLVGAHGVPGGNALVFGSDGTLYAHGASTTNLYTLNPLTAASTLVGNSSYSSAGDLAFVGDSLYLSTTSNELVEIDVTSGVGSAVGGIGFGSVFGLATDPDTNTLFGLSNLTLLAISAATGVGSSLFANIGGGFGNIYGTSFFGEAAPPIGDVPVPGALWLMATALASAAAVRRRPAVKRAA